MESVITTESLEVQETSERLPVTERVGYAVGDTASCLYWQTFSLFLVYFYTDVFGISAAAAGTMLLITRIWDTVTDPIMGGVADRTRSRFGRFRPWLLWGAVPLAVTGVLTFYTPPFGAGGKLVYAYVTYSLVMLAYTVVNIPYGALLGVISPRSSERTELSSYRFLGAFLGNLIVQGTLIALVGLLGGGDERRGFPLAMIVYGVMAASLFSFTFSSTKERVSPPRDQKTSARQDVLDLLGNRPWLVLGLMSLLVLIGVSIRNAAIIYYFKYYVGDEHHAAYFMTSGTVVTLVGVASTAWISRVLGGKKKAFIVLLVINVAALFLVQAAGPGDLLLIYGTNALGSLASGPLFPLIWSMYADTADYAEWRTGRRATGIIFSTATFAQKIGWTIGGSVAGWVLSAYGFQANVAQSASVLGGMRSMMGWIPAVVCGAAVLVAMLYNLDQSSIERLEAELRARRRAPRAT